MLRPAKFFGPAPSNKVNEWKLHNGKNHKVNVGVILCGVADQPAGKLRGAFDVDAFACCDIVVAVFSGNESEVGEGVVVLRPCVLCGDAGDVNGGLVVSKLPGGCAAGLADCGAQCTEGVYHADIGGG